MTEPTLSLVIVEDQLITRAGLKMILEAAPDLRVIGEADDGPSGVRQTLELKPALVLMDILLPGFDGIEATKQIKAALPQTRVLMLTTFERSEDVFAALGAGADGYCLKTIDGPQLHNAIRAVAQGAAWLDAGIAKRVLDGVGKTPVAPKAQDKSKFALSAREVEVLQLIVEGLSNQEIADRLTVSAETVKTHVRHVMEKLVVSDRTQAAVKALRQGLV